MDVTTSRKLIKTQIYAPSRYQLRNDDTDRLFNEFQGKIISELDLPDNWTECLSLGQSDNFFMLKENLSYKARVFHRFKKGENVKYSIDLVQVLKDYIEDKTTAPKVY